MVAGARGLAREALDSLTLGVRRIPQFGVVALADPQQQIEVSLESGPRAIDVTARTVAVSLEPLRIAVGLDAPARAVWGRSDGQLVFREPAARGAEVARLELRHERSLALPGGARAGNELAIFRPIGGIDACVSPLRRSLYYGWKRWDGRRRPAPPEGFETFKHLLVHYVCPRPVALVSVMDDGTRGNLFPMDLLGQVVPGAFVAALKNTNRTIESVRRSRRIVVSRIPLELSKQAYALADMHRSAHIDWAAAPVALARSAGSGYPIPARALVATEVEIHHTEDMGSHTALVGVPVHEQRLNEGRGMHHVSGLYHERCQALGRPL
jgi:flavin reductase (DIM6/NTAB) family NADH-FMN oxidoreductase RutF